MKIIDQTQSYTFSKYFEMGISAQDLAEELEYKFTRKRLNLKQYQGELDELKKLQQRLNEVLPYFDLANETSRREVLISPIILDLVHYTKSQVRIEYQIKINEQLQGYLDYLLKNHDNLLVIEAKKQDLDFGFTQLTAQLIALDQWEKMGDQEILIGAVTTGNIWQFGRLNRQQKHIEQGLDLYRVPDDLDPLMRILVQALS
ncbi:type I restriction enzyme HsdR N-terminal domain-containing protein [Geminocystis sp. GBBB08]|uniref:type I restriction enzyme HsdR N-terminal domain-containing protein n=1 Tax=Geminocystis sp. GBBB08 TaxID=2604140 RepID=UPI0027E31DEF|nr:type I restriction enzyme HsdR N-terminal domain-containing protein [Geminocystis sp. GBBB08]MBL1210791.1 hypothetical protein [Geminocystis sp. GBBB08]